MIRAAIYARFSSELQNDKSVDDQIAFCREIAAREGFAVAMTFEDRAVSGSSSVNRPGFASMMRAAEAKLFDVIVAEDMDRIFRDQADYHNAASGSIISASASTPRQARSAGSKVPCAR